MMIRKFTLLFAGWMSFISVMAQDIDQLIQEETARRMVTTLSSDAMQGRKIFTPSIDSAAAFIAAEFARSGIQKWNSATDYYQSFQMLKSTKQQASGTADGASIESKNIIAVSTQPNLEINAESGYSIKKIEPGKNLMREAFGIVQQKENVLVFVPESYASDFSRINRLNRTGFESPNSVLFVLANDIPEAFSFSITQEMETSSLKNVIGYLPGNRKPNEYVVFSAHYDHIGIGKPNEAGDSIFNGANDNAAGTTAIMMLADYFKAIGGNERSILFVAFTGEESGGFGSRYFSSRIKPEDVVAMFNIEMVGTESKWGKNSAYITGFEKSDFGIILQKNIEGTSFRFEADPYPQQQLFYRSDNATLAALGVPAHSISTAKMENEKFYHTVEDEVENIDIPNMTAIIKAIALSSRSIIEGKDTPTRVEAQER